MIPDCLRLKSGSSTLQMVPTEKPEGIFEAHFPSTTEPVGIEGTSSFYSSPIFFSFSFFALCFDFALFFFWRFFFLFRVVLLLRPLFGGDLVARVT